MAKRSKAEVDALTTRAAWIFATQTRDADEIASLLKTSKRSVERYAESELWAEVLKSLDYQGPRNFRVNPTRETARDANGAFEKAREVYMEAKESGAPKHRWATLTATATGVPLSTLYTWVAKYGWN